MGQKRAKAGAILPLERTISHLLTFAWAMIRGAGCQPAFFGQISNLPHYLMVHLPGKDQ
jgi:hypothetical protein